MTHYPYDPFQLLRLTPNLPQPVPYDLRKNRQQHRLHIKPPKLFTSQYV